MVSVLGLSHQGAEISRAIQPANGNFKLSPGRLPVEGVGARCLRRSGALPTTKELQGNCWEFWGRRRRDQATQDFMKLSQKGLRTTVYFCHTLCAAVGGMNVKG